MYYIYKVQETSSVVFAVEAMTEEDAERRVFTWEAEHQDEVRERLNNRCASEDSIEAVLLNKDALKEWNQQQADGSGYDFLIKKQTTLQETKDWNIHIRFLDGSNPCVYYRKTFGEMVDILKKWSENFILQPDKCYGLAIGEGWMSLVAAERK